MRRILAMILVTAFLFNTTLANTVKVTVEDMGVTVNSDEGSEIEITPKDDRITGWDVVTDNTEVVENKFTMPDDYVEIEGIIEEEVTPEKYILTYDANGGTGAPASVEFEEGDSVTISTTEPARSGYTFLGWSTSSGATSAQYTGGDTISPEGNETLYAVWEENVTR